MNPMNLTYDELCSELICNDDLSSFYSTLNEERFLNNGYNLEELHALLMQWFIDGDEALTIVTVK